jgi:hypothetical protein
MTKTIEISDVPAELYALLAVRAADNDVTLSEYVVRELESIVQRPKLAESIGQVRAGAGADTGSLAADLIRERRGPLP